METNLPETKVSKKTLICYWYMNRPTDQYDTTENSAVYSIAYGHLVYEKSSIPNLWFKSWTF